MEWIEVTGKTLEQARERALDELGVHESELQFEVIDEPRQGLFGRIGHVDARIRARVKPISREKPGERRRRGKAGPDSRGGRGGRGGRQGRGGEGSGGGGSRPAGGGQKDGEKDGEQRDAAPRGGAARPGGESAGTGPATAAGGAPRKRRRSRSGRKPSGSGEQGPATDGDRQGQRSGGSANEGGTVEEMTVPIEEQAAAAGGFMTGLVEAFGLGATVSTELGDDAVQVDVEGDGLGLLVGPKGTTLAALEELVRAAVSRSTGGHRVRVHLDVAGYRRRRREALAEFARGLAEEVRSSGAAKALEPMPAPDRKVVHDTVAEMDGVATSSEGEDLRRHVVIRPA